MYPELSESERFPLLSERGRKQLHAMRQHAHAPVWNWPNGEQLNESGLARVNQFAEKLQTQQLDSLDPPDWLAEFTERCLNQVPFYRHRTRSGTTFETLPTCCRADLAPRPWEFVPDDQALDEVIVFSSSGTTGQPTRTPHHPCSAACGIPLLEYALRDMYGVKFPRGPEHNAILNVVAYPDAYTTAIVVAYLQEAGCIRVNLHPSAWRQSDDPERYLNDWQAPIWLGDPLAFGILEKMKLSYQPQAIISSIMHLNEGYAAHLRQRYNCPVLDVYALTEAGIVAVQNGHGHRILPPDLYVEILDEAGNRCLPGERGEITLTGGRNPFLPLLRYRTGDFASIKMMNGQRVLVNLIGREPVEYVSDTGQIIHSMEIVRLMRRFPVRRYELRPVDGGYELFLEGDLDRGEVVGALRHLLGDHRVK